jgi:hypothetical protein
VKSAVPDQKVIVLLEDGSNKPARRQRSLSQSFKMTRQENIADRMKEVGGEVKALGW